MRSTSAALLASVLALGSPAFGAPWDRSGRLDHVIAEYDRSRVETVRGTVERIYEKVPSTRANPDSLGIHMVLRTGTETVDVHLGPRWYIRSLDGLIEKGDAVEVTGAAETGYAPSDGKPGTREICAAEVRKGGEAVLKLRDADGKPLWSGY